MGMLKDHFSKEDLEIAAGATVFALGTAAYLGLCATAFTGAAIVGTVIVAKNAIGQKIQEISHNIW